MKKHSLRGGGGSAEGGAPSKTEVLLYMSYVGRPRNQAWPMELIHRHLEAGDRVRVVRCEAALPACHHLKTHVDPSHCLRCTSRSNYAVKRVGVPAEDRLVLSPQPEANSLDVPEFADVETLKAFEVCGINVGTGVASSLISKFRDHDFDPREHGGAVERSVRAAVHVLYFFQRYLDEHDVDLVYVFNGRFADVRPVVELCRQRGIPFRTWEKGWDREYVQVFDNALVHDVAASVRNMDVVWEQAADKADREAVAERWFRNRRGGVKQDQQPVFVGAQKDGYLPGGFDPSKRNVAIFNSSEDEFAALDDSWANPLYRDQNEALRQILGRVGPETGVHFTLRVHPNLSGLDNTQTRGVAALVAPNLTVVPGDSDVDTYALMDACDAVLTFGSTTGVEATFWGRPSILYGRSKYESLGAVHRPESLDELIEMLLDPALGPRPREGALKFAYWFITRGEPVETFADLFADDPGAGYSLRERVLFRLLPRVRQLPLYERVAGLGASVWTWGLQGSARAPVRVRDSEDN